MRNKILELLRLEKAQIQSVGWEEEIWDIRNSWERALGQGLGKGQGNEELGLLGKPKAGERNSG